jgi:acyl-CoA thioesterase FadM
VKTRLDEAITHRADFAEHTYRNQRRPTVNWYEKPFEIRGEHEVRLGDLITVTHQVIGYSADGKRWCSRNQVLRADGAIVTTAGAWFGITSRRIQAPPPELVAATDAVRSRDFIVLESSPA